MNEKNGNSNNNRGKKWEPEKRQHAKQRQSASQTPKQMNEKHRKQTADLFHWRFLLFCFVFVSQKVLQFLPKAHHLVHSPTTPTSIFLSLVSFFPSSKLLFWLNVSWKYGENTVIYTFQWFATSYRTFSYQYFHHFSWFTLTQWNCCCFYCMLNICWKTAYTKGYPTNWWYESCKSSSRSSSGSGIWWSLTECVRQSQMNNR